MGFLNWLPGKEALKIEQNSTKTTVAAMLPGYLPCLGAAGIFGSADGGYRRIVMFVQCNPDQPD
jgi:hypothetical protein